MTTNPTLCRACVTPIGYINSPTGGWWAHETHPTDEHDAVPGAWVDGDPLMEAMAAAVWEHCDVEGTSSVIVDDPRNIAAVAAAVARAAVSVPAPAPTEEVAEVAKHVTRAIFALKTPSPDGSTHYQSGWDDGLEAAMDAARDAVLAALPAPTDQTALRARLDTAIDDVFTRWQTGLGGQRPQDAIRDAILAALSVPADRPACDCEAEVHMGVGFYHQPQCATRNSQPADRAAILRAEAEHLIRDLYPAVYEDAGYKTALGVNRAARELLDRADEAALHAEVAASGSGRVADETQAQPECAHCGREIENKAEPNMGGPTADHWVHVPGGYTTCHPQQGTDSPRAEPRPAVVAQTDGEA